MLFAALTVSAPRWSGYHPLQDCNCGNEDSLVSGMLSSIGEDANGVNSLCRGHFRLPVFVRGWESKLVTSMYTVPVGVTMLELLVGTVATLKLLQKMDTDLMCITILVHG